MFFSKSLGRFKQKFVCNLLDTWKLKFDVMMLVYSNYDPGVTLTYFMARSNLKTLAFL